MFRNRHWVNIYEMLFFSRECFDNVSHWTGKSSKANFTCLKEQVNALISKPSTNQWPPCLRVRHKGNSFTNWRIRIHNQHHWSKTLYTQCQLCSNILFAAAIHRTILIRFDYSATFQWLICAEFIEKEGFKFSLSQIPVLLHVLSSEFVAT